MANIEYTKMYFVLIYLKRLSQFIHFFLFSYRRESRIKHSKAFVIRLGQSAHHTAETTQTEILMRLLLQLENYVIKCRHQRCRTLNPLYIALKLFGNLRKSYRLSGRIFSSIGAVFGSDIGYFYGAINLFDGNWEEFASVAPTQSHKFFIQKWYCLSVFLV